MQFVAVLLSLPALTEFWTSQFRNTLSTVQNLWRTSPVYCFVPHHNFIRTSLFLGIYSARAFCLVLFSKKQLLIGSVVDHDEKSMTWKMHDNLIQLNDWLEFR